MKFPIQVNPSTGRFAVSSGEQSVKESVYLILMTNRGERWLLPDFGGTLVRYAFMDTSLTMLTIMSNEIRRVLAEQEPRIGDIDVEIDRSDERADCLVVNIRYMVRETNTPENLVFPFYLNNSEVVMDDEDEL